MSTRKASKRNSFNKRVIILILFLSLLIIGGGCFFYGKILSLTGLTPTIIYKTIFTHQITLHSSEGRTNLLLLGMGGGLHEGSDLTDTIVILSIRTSDRKLSLISIPRDFWSENLKDKINTAYHYGEAQKPGKGLELAKTEVEAVTGLPIHYSIIIDFSGFKKVIDTLGGINVQVMTTFTDTQYPIEGRENDLCNGDPDFACRYQTVTFIRGVDHMNGERALMYVRSRHADGEEGTDFARSRRQQEVIAALQKKISDYHNWWLFLSNISWYKALDEMIYTDLSISDKVLLANLLLKYDKKSLNQISIDKLLINPPESEYEGRYVLIPENNINQIHSYINQKLE